MASDKKQNYLKGAAILTATVMLTKVIGALYKIPLYNIIGDQNAGIFNATYSVYNVVLTICTAGVPVALSRLISSAATKERPNQVRRYFNVAMPAFTIIGFICFALMLLFSHQIAAFTEVYETAASIRVLAPAVLFCCICCVYRGYGQGFEDMIPTAISQIMESGSKLVFGLAIGYLLLKAGKSDEIVCAGAITGVTVGLGLSLPILAIYTRKKNLNDPLFKRTVDIADPPTKILVEIFKTSIPVTIGSSALSIFTLIDTKISYHRLQTAAGFSYEQAKTLYGVFSKALALFSLPSSLFIVPLTVSVVPAIAAAVARRDKKDARGIMESALKVNNLLAMPAGMGMCVLAYSIFNVLYWGSNENGPVLLAVLGIASYFVCLQLVTMSILQAYGHEKTALITIPLGGIVKIIVSWYLVGRAGIIGAPVGTLACYLVMSVINLIYIAAKVPDRPSLLKTSARPLICCGIMGAAAWAVNGLITKSFPVLAGGRVGMAVIMCVTIFAAVIIYLVCVVALGAVTREDMRYLPKGEKISRLLRLK